MVRKFFRRSARGRRRRTSETYTLVQCSDCHNVYQDLPCGGPLITATEILTHRTPRNTLGVDNTELASGSDKFLVADGLKFQAEHWHDPATSQGFASCDPSPLQLVFMLRIWEAIVVLPFAQGTQIPAYLPDFTAMITQGGKFADRVLWKRLNQLPIWGLNVVTASQLESTVRDFGHGPVVVKSKVKLDDQHGLYYVRNYTHDVAGLGNPGADSCVAQQTTNPCVIPINTDAWFKIFFHTRK